MSGSLTGTKLLVENADSSTLVEDTLIDLGGSNMVVLQLANGLTGTVQLVASIDYDEGGRMGSVQSGELGNFKDPITLEVGQSNLIHLVDLPVKVVGLDLSGVAGSGDIKFSEWQGGR